MKVDLRDLLDPAWKYFQSVSVLARVLQVFMRSAESYREKGRWGDSGPHEVLCDHNSCVNCQSEPWTSSRRGSATWEEHRDVLSENLLSAMLGRRELFMQWRKEQGIDWETPVPLHGRKHGGSANEKTAFMGFMALHLVQLPYSANKQHKDCKTLCFPMLFISRKSISLSVSVSSKAEVKRSGRCASRWDLGWLLKESPVWSPAKETFTEYCFRARGFYLAGKEPK